jgi:hypothetical protein
MTSAIKADRTYGGITTAAIVATIPAAAVAVFQFFFSGAGVLTKVGDVLSCIAFPNLALTPRLHRSGKRIIFILDAISSLALAITFSVVLIDIALHPSTTGDGDEVGIFIFPAILLFLTHSFMALVRFQTEVDPWPQ